MRSPSPDPPGVRNEIKRPKRPLRRLLAILFPPARCTGLGQCESSLPRVPTTDGRRPNRACGIRTRPPPGRARRRYDASNQDPRDPSDGSVRSSCPLHDALALAQCESSPPPCPTTDGRWHLGACGMNTMPIAEPVRQQHATLSVCFGTVQRRASRCARRGASSYHLQRSRLPMSSAGASSNNSR